MRTEQCAGGKVRNLIESARENARFSDTCRVSYIVYGMGNGQHQCKESVKIQQKPRAHSISPATTIVRGLGVSSLLPLFFFCLMRHNP